MSNISAENTKPKISAKANKTLKKIWEYKTLYFFLVPMVAWFLVFAYAPMVGNLLAFKDYSFTKGILNSPWVGLKYFKQFFSYYDFKSIVTNTIVIALMKIILEFPIPIIFAMLVNEVMRPNIKKVMQSISYLPNFVSWIIVIQMFNMLLSPNGGVVNTILVNLHIIDKPIYFIGEKNAFLPIVFITDMFKNVGWSSIIYLAALSAVSQETYEAAAIDGANRFEQAIHVTWPAIKPTAGLLFILGFAGILRSGFDQIYLMQSPGNLALSETLDTFVFKQGLLSGNISYSTAVGFFQSFISLIMIVCVNKFAQKFMEVSLW